MEPVSVVINSTVSTYSIRCALVLERGSPTRDGNADGDPLEFSEFNRHHESAAAHRAALRIKQGAKTRPKDCFMVSLNHVSAARLAFDIP